MKLLEGKVAVVTGAGSGVGRGVAIALARAGAQTVVSSRTVAKCKAVVDEIAKEGGEGTALECDVRLQEDIDACVAQTLERYGGIDALVNAADDPRVDVPLLETTQEVMLASWNTGVIGTLRFTRRSCPTCEPGMVAPS
jgi:NAD(P)-dependent dehydrogenase (short-subunit alcohol dehydrogenase family)